MAEQKCFESVCDKIAEFKCNCSWIQTFWCHAHIVTHIAYSSKNHSTKLILSTKKISDRWKAIAKHHLKLEKWRRKYNIVEGLAEIYKQKSRISEINKKLQAISNIQLSYYSKLYAEAYNKIQIFNYEINKVRLTGLRLLLIDEPTSNFWNDLMVFKIDINSLEKLIERLLLENQIKIHFLKKISGEIIYNQLKSEFKSKIEEIEYWPNLSYYGDILTELINSKIRANYFFRIDQNNLYIYGAPAFNSKIGKCKFYLHIWQEAYNDCHEIFCIWNDKTACKIDRKSMKITKILPSSKGKSLSALIYYKDCVYLFSLKSKYPDLYYLEKYDLKENRKIYLPSPSVNVLSNYSCTIYRESILFCAKDSQVLHKFDLLIESYSEHLLEWIDKSCFKMLFTGNMKVYMADAKCGIFESGVWDEYVWNKVRTHNYNPLSQFSEYSIYLSSIEFDAGDTYKFDLRSKEVYDTALDYFRRFDAQKYPICLYFE